MSKVVKFVAANLLAFSSLFFVSPAFATDGWVTSTGNVVDGSVQFSYYQGSASQSFDAPEGSTLTITVNNTVSNRIGYGEPLPDFWSVSVNGVVFSGSSVEVRTISVPVSGSVVVVVSGVDRGFWAGWYGPIFSAPVISVPVVEVVSESVVRSEDVVRTEVVVRPEPVVEPVLPQPIPQPAPEPVYEPAPPIEEPVVPTPEASPEPVPEVPESPTEAPEPVVEVVEPPVVVEPVVEPSVAVDTPEMLAAAAEADDPVVPQELAAIPLLGDAAVAILEAFNALGNIGADMTPEVRETAQETIVASVIVSNIASTSVMASAASYRRMK